MSKNNNLHSAKINKNDEFYTQLSDIEEEISMHEDYVRQFEGKTVLCNCDDPEWSNFYEFFRLHFKQLKLKKLITTHYNMDGSPSYKLEWSGEKLGKDTVNMIKTPLQSNGDFRDDECIELLKEADIVVTNPPFSLFRKYIAQLMEYNKKFIVLANMNCITYKEFFPLLKDNKVWSGYGFNKSVVFKSPYENQLEANRKFVKSKGYNPDDNYIKVPAICWFTNLDIDKRHEDLILTKRYQGNEDRYPHYDNYDAINIDKVTDIPKDYYGAMGVPITFLDKFNPSQFEIIGLLQSSTDEQAGIPNLRYYNDFKEMRQDMTFTGASGGKANGNPVVQGKSEKGNFLYNPITNEYVHSVYARILIKLKYKEDGKLNG